MSSYGFSKLSGERYLDAFNREYGIDYVVVRPFNVTGCGEYPQTEVGMAHVTNDIIRKIHEGQGTKDNALQILGDGEQIRHYTVLQECAAGILAATFLGKSGEAYNISSKKGHTVNELVDLIWSKMRPNQKLHKKHIDGYEFDVQKRVPNTYKARNDFGFECKLTIEDTIQDTIQWTINVLKEENVTA
jgi:nucleoside-diphosphate-sugar epimerase